MDALFAKSSYECSGLLLILMEMGVVVVVVVVVVVFNFCFLSSYILICVSSHFYTYYHSR